MKPFFAFIIIFCLCWMNLQAFNLRKSGFGVNGSLINSIFQDTKGIMWVGTNAGLSRFDGKLSTQIEGFGSINKMTGTFEGDIVAETLYGLKIYNSKSDSVSNFDMFGNSSFLVSDKKGSIFLVQGNGSIYYKTKKQNTFDNIIVRSLIANELCLFRIQDNILYILSVTGNIRSFEIVYYNDNSISLEEKKNKNLGVSIMYCFESENDTYIIDNNYNLCKLDVTFSHTLHLKNLKDALSQKGKLTTGIVFKEDFYFGCETGLYCVRDNEIVKIPLKTGISCLYKDKFQDLIWVGTLGDGLFTLSYEQHSINSHLLQDFYPSVSKPISSICYLDNNTLWLGTLGNGIVFIPDFNSDKEIKNAHHISLGDKLEDNTVYSSHKSKLGIWIGCKSGLFFYSYKSKSISKISEHLKNIYAISEQDSLLWIACYERGIARANFSSKGELPKLDNLHFYALNRGEEVSNRFSSIKVNKNKLLFLNQRYGIYEIVNNELSLFIQLPSVNQIEPIDNVSFMISSDFGVYLLTNSSKNPLFSAPAKEIIHSSWSDFWLSTDRGLLLYNIDLNSVRYFDDRYGLRVNEYLNGSVYMDQRTSTLFFGGVNGFTTLRYNDYDEAMDYMPTLFLEKLSVFGVENNKIDFEDENLVFDSDENFFSITFNAPDYINGYNYSYYYKIGENGQWIDNGNSGTISFNDLNSGNYDLYVKYYNKMLNKESYIKHITFRILPPLFKSIYAYVVYMMVVIGLVYLLFLTISKRKQRKIKEEVLESTRRRKEEIHEAKLEFFTDVAHELCTPLTLISGPCNLILKQKNVSLSISKYAEIINRNAKRMNSLINDLMSFKQMESGHKQALVKELNITDLADHILDTFQINTSGTKISIKRQYPKNIYWNTDEYFFTSILVNLISNAVKYSEAYPIIVEIHKMENNLLLKVTNRGRGLSDAEISSIFNKYTVLDRTKSGDWKQNGLGLAITSGMVKLMGGEICVESIPNETTSFLVSFPQIEVQITAKSENQFVGDNIIPEFVFPPTHYEFCEDRKTVAVIDDDPEMLWFICDVLTPDFNVLPVQKPNTIKEVLLRNHVDILLCDVMMDGVDGLKLTEMIKADKTSLHIPLIIVSAVHDIKIQTKAIDIGAELYITKPFDVTYLKSAIHRLVGRKEDLKDYFSSPLSAYEQSMGKLQHTEHRKFLKKLYSIITKNIIDENLTPYFIASELGMSTRSLYRKVKEATDKGLNEIINDGKLSVAENLLLKSKFTIDEIVYKSGFSNRASFYRAFSRKHGCSPTAYVEGKGTFY